MSSRCAAYVFEDLQSFLDLYYAVPRLVPSRTSPTSQRRTCSGRRTRVRHAEIFFDPDPTAASTSRR
jgi:hypothetical protein